MKAGVNFVWILGLTHRSYRKGCSQAELRVSRGDLQPRRPS